MAFRNTRSSRAHWMAADVLVALLVMPSLLTSTYAGTRNHAKYLCCSAAARNNIILRLIAN
jgi:hypothetical protein